MAFVELRQTIIEILADYFSGNGLWKLLSLRQVALSEAEQQFL